MAGQITQPWAAFENRIRESALGTKMTRNVSMADYTTLHLGGKADLMLEPACAKDVQLILQTAQALKVPLTVIGRGSNLLVRDGGIRGVVLRIAGSMKRVQADGETITAEAGAMMPAVAMAAAEHHLAGMAFAGGIPGTVGGGVMMNAGAYGGEMTQVVSQVEGFDRLTGTPFCYTGAEMAFGYRTSRLQGEDKVVTSVTFRLQKGDGAAIRAEMADYNRRRAEKQPLDVPSAGSTFRRPKTGYAAALIDECGLKGVQVGGAQVSEKHAGFLLNRGGTAADFLALMALVQRTVLEKTGVALESEVCILGEDAATKEI